jgi:hypothetical protein
VIAKDGVALCRRHGRAERFVYEYVLFEFSDVKASRPEFFHNLVKQSNTNAKRLERFRYRFGRHVDVVAASAFEFDDMTECLADEGTDAVDQALPLRIERAAVYVLVDDAIDALLSDVASDALIFLFGDKECRAAFAAVCITLHRWEDRQTTTLHNAPRRSIFVETQT